MTKLDEDASSQEVIDRGLEVYDRLIRPSLEQANFGRIVAIDVNSEEFEVDDESLEATFQLRKRMPEAVVAILKIGGGEVFRIGYFPLRTSP